jgi:hypothetical protein
MYLTVCKISHILSRPSVPIEATGDVAASAETAPIDFEEMAAEQSCCPETQRLLGGQQAGAHCLNLEKTFFLISTISHILGDLPPDSLFHLGTFGKASHGM